MCVSDIKGVLTKAELRQPTLVFLNSSLPIVVTYASLLAEEFIESNQKLCLQGNGSIPSEYFGSAANILRICQEKNISPMHKLLWNEIFILRPYLECISISEEIYFCNIADFPAKYGQQKESK